MKVIMMADSERSGLNKKLYKEFLKGNPSICYMASLKSSESYSYYKSFKRSVKKETKDVHFISIDKKINNKMMNQLKSADVIFMDGGNTFFLMNSLRKNGYFSLLKKFKNKTFVGVSAGAIAMTSKINLAMIPTFTADENKVKLKNLKGLSLVDFEFHPHAKESLREFEEIQKYSTQKSHKIYLCKDGQGIVSENQKVKPNGKIYEFKNGKKKPTRGQHV